MVKAIRGFNDILPGESGLWRWFESEAQRVFETYGFAEIRLPVVEKTELFIRGIGDTTDIVSKEMYTFPDRKGESLTLRPEGTASAVRAYVEHKQYTSPLTKVYYSGPMFRYERPQKGRQRQFYQIGAEVLGDASPAADAETIAMLMDFFKAVGVEGTLYINSLGCSSCRPVYKIELLRFLGVHTDELCKNCTKRIEENPLRALDCKSPKCREATTEAPSIIDHLCLDCNKHFDDVIDLLNLMKIKYHTDHRMVRGLDYYTRTTFEVKAEGLGAQDTIAAGGRYDKLVSELNGPDTPCVGFALGMERLAIVYNSNEDANKPAPLDEPLIYVITLGKAARKAGMEIIKGLREDGRRVEADLMGESVKKSMKRADKLGAAYALLLGDNELEEGKITIKDMKAAEQTNVPLDKISTWLAERASKKA